MWGLCHDDGSSGFVDTFNFLPWSGTKNYLGYNKTSFGNWFVYSDYAPVTQSGGVGVGNGWNACAMSYSSWSGAFGDHWENNTCITSSAGRAQWALNDCNANNPTDGTVPLFSNNVYSNPDMGYAFPCGKNKTSLSLAEAQAVGVDVGSTVVPLFSNEEIIAAGHQLLMF